MKRYTGQGMWEGVQSFQAVSGSTPSWNLCIKKLAELKSF